MQAQQLEVRVGTGVSRLQGAVIPSGVQKDCVSSTGTPARPEKTPPPPRPPDPYKAALIVLPPDPYKAALIVLPPDPYKAALTAFCARELGH